MKPILFNTEMVKAILDGRKTMMRRVVKYKPDYYIIEFHNNCGSQFIKEWKPGDVLYVRAPTRIPSYHTHDSRPVSVELRYLADGSCVRMPVPERFINREWFRKYRRIPNGCFREAARIFLKVTDVRVERLQDITEKDGRKEGIGDIGGTDFLCRLFSRFMGQPQRQARPRLGREPAGLCNQF